MDTPKEIDDYLLHEGKRPCPICNFPIGKVAGTKEAICKNCGFKDPCCD